MTLPAATKGLGGRLPSDTEQDTANQLRQVIASHRTEGTKLSVIDGGKKPTEITLAPAVSDLLIELLRYIGGGSAVTLMPVSKMLTTQQAADILNVSRPFLIKLLERKEISYELVGRHRRISARDLFAYKERRSVIRGEALSALAENDGELL